MQLLNGQAQIINRQIVVLKETITEAPGRENEDKLKTRMFAEMLLELMMKEAAAAGDREGNGRSGGTRQDELEGFAVGGGSSED
jgi:hypothetical protein